MKRFLLTSLGMVVAITSLIGLQVSSPAYAAGNTPTPAGNSSSTSSSQAAVCEGVGSATGSTGCSTTGKSVNSLVTTLVDLLSAIVGIAAVVMIIIAGLKYITAGGDSSSIGSAKNTLIYAIVGMIIVAAAQNIDQFGITTAS